MAITALNSAATGLRALSTQIDVIANNLANAETKGFKRSRANFEDLMYQEFKQPGAISAADDASPSGIQVGLGTKLSNTQVDMTQGSFEQTNSNLDLAIDGNGFFRVKVLDSIGDGTAYTRNGNFFLNKNNEMVLGLGDGYRLVPPIKFPAGVTESEISISAHGTVTVSLPGARTAQQVGQIQLTQFANPQGLKLLGGSLFLETEASGIPVTTKPQENGAGQIKESYLETSNVDPTTELVSLIKTQRAFELNSQSIQTADQALQTIANLRRG